MDGSGIRIDGAPNGAVWVVNSHNLIFKRENNRYINIDGLAHDITCANNGDIYHIGNEFSIWKRIAMDWLRIDGQGQSVSCGLSLWVLNFTIPAIANAIPAMYEMIVNNGPNVMMLVCTLLTMSERPCDELAMAL